MSINEILPAEIISLILRYARNRMVKSCVCQLWHELSKPSKYKKYGSKYFVRKCASLGHSNIIKWLILYYKIRPSDIYNGAAFGNQKQIIEELYKFRPTKKSEVCTYAVHGGNFELLKWLRSQGFRWDETTVCEAIICGRLDILKYCLENKCPHSENIIVEAGIEGQIEIYEYLKSIGYEEKENASFDIFYNCPPKMFAYLRHLWTKDTFQIAVVRNDLQIVEYLYENGCVNENALNYARSGEMSEYLISKGFEYTDERDYESDDVGFMSD